MSKREASGREGVGWTRSFEAKTRYFSLSSAVHIFLSALNSLAIFTFINISPYYQSLDLLEISQNFHDDWYYFQDVLTNDNYDDTSEQTDASKYDAYLQTMWERAIKPENGLMVFQGHPMYSGISKTSMQPLEKIVRTAKDDDAWITSIGNVASYWNQRKELDIIVSELGNEVTLNFKITDNSTINNLSFKLPSRPKKVVFAAKHKILETDAGLFLVLESVKNQSEIILKF